MTSAGSVKLRIRRAPPDNPAMGSSRGDIHEAHAIQTTRRHPCPRPLAKWQQAGGWGTSLPVPALIVLIRSLNPATGFQSASRARGEKRSDCSCRWSQRPRAVPLRIRPASGNRLEKPANSMMRTPVPVGEAKPPSFSVKSHHPAFLPAWLSRLCHFAFQIGPPHPATPRRGALCIKPFGSDHPKRNGKQVQHSPD